MFKININNYTKKEEFKKLDLRLQNYNSTISIVETIYVGNIFNYNKYNKDTIVVYLDEQIYIAEVLTGKNIKKTIKTLNDLFVIFKFKNKI